MQEFAKEKPRGMKIASNEREIRISSINRETTVVSFAFCPKMGQFGFLVEVFYQRPNSKGLENKFLFRISIHTLILKKCFDKITVFENYQFHRIRKYFICKKKIDARSTYRFESCRFFGKSFYIFS